MAASGYESRQPGRSTFAFDVGQPIQTRSTLDPAFRGGQVVGGDSIGGVVRGSPMTMPTGDDGIPEFLARMVEPYIREKQSEAVVKGATDFIAGKTIKDIAKGDSGVASIFGPSGYHQGAAAFAATSAWTKAKADILADPESEKMDARQLSTFLAGKYRDMQTGDPITDQLLQQSMMQDHGPLVQTLTARHEAWVQTEALTGTTNTWNNRANGLQQIARETDEASPASVQARATATSNYLAGLTKPGGMKDEVWHKAIVGHARAALSSGSFYAFEAMKSRGLYETLTDDEQVKLDTAYGTAAADALGKVASDPEINSRLAALDMQVRVGITDGRTETPMTAEKIAGSAAEINALAARLTGVSGRDLFDGDDILALQKQLNGEQVAAGLRVQARIWEQERDESNHRWELEKRQIEAADDMLRATTYAARGNVGAAIATGRVKEADANEVFGRAAAAGDMGLLAKNFGSGQYVNHLAASELQAPIGNSIGHGVTADFKKAHQQWGKLNAANPSAAVAYFGKFAADMEGYDRLVRGGETEQSAYAQTVARAPEVGNVSLPQGVTDKEARSAIAAAISANDRGWLTLGKGRVPLAESSVTAMTGWLLKKAGDYARRSGSRMDTAAANAQRVALASGEIERAGPFVWNNIQPTKRLSTYLGLPDDSVDRLVTSVAGDRLKKAGFEAGAGGDEYNVMRLERPDGSPALYVQAFHPDHSGHVDVFIDLADLAAANRKEIAAKVEAAKPKPIFPHIDISAEGTAARRASYKGAMKTGHSVDLDPYIAKAATDVTNAAVAIGVAAATPAATGKSAVKAAVGAMHRQFERKARRK